MKKDKVSIMLHAALDLQRAEEYHQALEILEKAKVLASDNVMVHLLTGLTYKKISNFKMAENALRDALALQPDNNDVLQALGLLLVSANRLTEATGYLKKHLRQDPNNRMTLDMYIPALTKAGHIDDALCILKTAWKETHSSDTAVRYVRFLLSHNRVNEACDFLMEIVDDTADPRLYVELSLTLVIEEKYEEAIVFLRKALSLDEEYDRALRGLAHCYTQLGKGEKALEMAESALAIDPNHYRNWQAKSDALLLLERFDDALEAASAGIDLIDKDDAEAQPVLAVLYMQKSHAFHKQGDTEGVLNTFATARQYLSADKRFYLYPIQILLQARLYGSAIELIEESIEAGIEWSESDTSLLFAFGIDLYTEGQSAVAMQWFEQLLKLKPESPRLLNAIGFIAIGVGKLEKAESYLQTALSVEGEDFIATTCNDLGYLYLLKNHLEEATKFLTRALRTPEDDSAFLRVAFWIDNTLISDYTKHPTRSISTHNAARANLATLALIQGDITSSLALANEITSSHPNERVGYMILGCIYLAQEKTKDAKQTWQKALSYIENERERKMVVSWLETLKKE